MKAPYLSSDYKTQKLLRVIRNSLPTLLINGKIKMELNENYLKFKITVNNAQVSNYVYVQMNGKEINIFMNQN